MRPASAGFLRAVRGSHTMTARARLVTPGQTGTDPDGEETPIVTGNVLLDATATVRGTVDLTTLGTFPDSPAHPLAPFGQEIFVERGLEFGNGVTEWISQGYFRLDDIEQLDVPKGAIRVAASDRMAGLEDARLLAPRQFGKARTLGSVVEELVLDVHPFAVIEWDDQAVADGTLGRPVVAEDDRLAFLADLVTAAGKVWHWDYRGVLVIADAPDPAAPVERLDAGENGVLVELSRALSRDGVYNGVVAMGEAPDTGTPVRAVAVDNDPFSPTYWDGPFGQVPRFYSSPFITTQEQAESAARAMLRRALGLPYTVELSTVPNPALEPLDPVTVAYPGVLNVLENETHVVESLVVPLTAAGAMRAATREKTLGNVGLI